MKKLEASEEFKKLMSEDEKAYFCSGFFVRDLEGEHNESQLDFYSPKNKKILSFDVNKKVKKIPIDKEPVNMEHKKFIPEKIEDKVNIDLDQIESMIMDGMHNRGMTDKIKKLIILLQEREGKNSWNCTCFLSGLGLLQVHLDDESETVLFMERKSFMDIIIPLKKGDSLKDVLDQRKSEKKFDIEKVEGTNEGFIG